MYPLALVAYNRPDHFRRVLQALAPQQPHPLYIFCDGPKDKADKERTDAVWKVIWDVVDWTRPLVFSGPHQGLAKSIIWAVDRVLRDHETVIVLEDDCLPGPWFLGFMTRCLEEYADDERVMAVTGYTPIAATEMYFSPRMETWGWGTRRRAWRLYERDVADAHRRAVHEGVNLEQGGSDLPRYMNQAMAGKDVWSAGWQLAAYLNGGLCAYPTRSHIRNIGLDGTGAHCGAGKDDAPLAEGIPTRFREAVVDGATEALRRFYG